MSAEQIERKRQARREAVAGGSDQASGRRGTGVSSRVRGVDSKVAGARSARPRRASGASPSHVAVALDGREPVFDHGTSHVLVSGASFAGKPIGGRKPAHLAEPTRVRLLLARIGPWSAFKLALLFGALAMAALVAALVIMYSLLGAAGVLDAVQKLVNSSGVGHHFRFDGGWLLARVAWVAGAMVLIGAVIAACMTVLYNSLADLTGGLDVTFVEHPNTVLRAHEAPTWTTRFRGMRLWRHDREVPPPMDGIGLPEASGQ